VAKDFDRDIDGQFHDWIRRSRVKLALYVGSSVLEFLQAAFLLDNLCVELCEASPEVRGHRSLEQTDFAKYVQANNRSHPNQAILHSQSQLQQKPYTKIAFTSRNTYTDISVAST
jgi:hypothetical protein